MRAEPLCEGRACMHAFGPILFVCMVITLWAIWGARKKAVYKNIFQSPLSTHVFIKSYLNDHEVLKKLMAMAV